MIIDDDETNNVSTIAMISKRHETTLTVCSSLFEEVAVLSLQASASFDQRRHKCATHTNSAVTIVTRRGEEESILRTRLVLGIRNRARSDAQVTVDSRVSNK